MIQLLIERCGVGVSLQDDGRPGYGRIGLPRSGALDLLALAAANILVGNPRDTVALELLMGGARLRISGGRARLALAGADCPVTVDQTSIGSHVSFLLEPGQLLTVGASSSGMCAIIAIEGGFDVPVELGSRSLHQRAEVGGFLHRTLRDGDVIPVTRAATPGPGLAMSPLPLAPTAPIRVVAGPQVGVFTDAGMASFLDAEFEVTFESDRMGYRLAGPAIEAKSDGRMISDGVPEGAIQVPGSGQPIVLLADHQTTGGYPKIATVVTPDIRIIAQRRPGDRVRFRLLSLDEARQALFAARDENERIFRQIRSRTAELRSLTSLAVASIRDNCVNAADPDTWDWPAASGSPIAA